MRSLEKKHWPFAKGSWKEVKTLIDEGKIGYLIAKLLYGGRKMKFW